ncbi:MAG: hypothetical protein ACE5Q6_12725 [Dehalococcoidia bacterium]
MRFSEQDADQFFELMFSLQLYAGQQLGALSNNSTLEEYRDCPLESKLQVRDALYENKFLIDSFIQENPAHLSSGDLAIVAKWKQFISGEFYVERLLKKYAIFVGPEDRVYGVLGLHHAFQDMIHSSQLPVYLKTVLLPFKGKIVYDGLLQPYDVYFGHGISSELKEVYMAAKQNGRIIEALDPDLQPERLNRKTAPAKDWKPQIDALVAAAQQLRSGAGQPAIHSPVFSLVKASMELAQQAVDHPNDLDAIRKGLQKVERTASRVETTLYRSE